jgi:hypothetical protein
MLCSLARLSIVRVSGRLVLAFPRCYESSRDWAVVVGLVLDRPSRAVREVVVGRPRGCFRRSGVGTETLGRRARSIIAAEDGDGPYGRQMAVDKVEKQTNTVGAFPLPFP